MSNFNEDLGIIKNRKVVLVGIGQGGTNMATKVYSMMNPKNACVVSINTSINDLLSAQKQGVAPENCIKISKVVKNEVTGEYTVDTSTNGTGKDRSISRTAMLQKSVILGDTFQYPAVVFNEKYEKLIYGADNYIILFYSLGGGTGSGGGLPFGLRLQREISEKMIYTNNAGENIDLNIFSSHRPVIKHVVIVPSRTNITETGDIPLANSSEAISEIQKTIEKKGMSCVIFDNGSPKYSNISNTSDRYNKINEDAATLLIRHIGVDGVNSDQCMDLADRKAMFTTPGVTSLMLLEDNVDVLTSVLPSSNLFFTRSIIEYPTKHVNDIDSVMKTLTQSKGIKTNVFNPIPIGEDIESLAKGELRYGGKPVTDYSFVALNGLCNISAVVDELTDSYQRIKGQHEASAAISKNMKTLDSVVIANQVSESKSNKISAVDVDDIFGEE